MSVLTRGQPSIGTHILINLYDVYNENLINLVDYGISIFQQFISHFNLNIITYNEHQFNDSGYSIMYLLREGHIIVHTFPNDNRCLIDILNCATTINTVDVIHFLRNAFDTNNVTYQVLQR